LSLVTKLELNERKLVSTSKKNDELTSISRTARAREKEAKMIAQSAEEEAIRLQNEMDSKLCEHEKQAKSELDFELTKARASCAFFSLVIFVNYSRELFSLQPSPLLPLHSSQEKHQRHLAHETNKLKRQLEHQKKSHQDEMKRADAEARDIINIKDKNINVSALLFIIFLNTCRMSHWS
jgi:hypothetical protein